MILADVNLLLYAHREEFTNHGQCREWLEQLIASREPFGMANVVLSGFIRIATHHKVF